jgi:FkbM family methyltransferase
LEVSGFWDIGANVGMFSLFAARIVGARGKAVAFEPSPDVFDLLRANTDKSRSIQILPYGIGSCDGTMAFAAQGTATSSSFIQESQRSIAI